MKRLFILLMTCFLFFLFSVSAQVGIGTTTPNPKAVLDIKSTDKGVIFPMLTNAQRDAIVNPPDGLHIFNKDERCLNFYDSLFSTWSCYCEVDTCKAVMIRLTSNTGLINFYTAYADDYPWARKFSILINPDVVIGGISFLNMPNNQYKIKIINRGSLVGLGGTGGGGASGQVGSCSINAGAGGAGGNAIETRPGLPIFIDNYGIVGGGGGGGGGGGKVSLGQYGGGGGGGAGALPATGGAGGGNTGTISFPINACIATSIIAQSGTNGTVISAGTGGTGASSGGNGGNGGGYAQVGQNGTGSSPGTGGAAGKAIASIGGASGSIINNIGGGQVFGVVE